MNHFEELCTSVYAEDFVKYAEDRVITARILACIANLLERNSHEFQRIEDASRMLRKMSFSIENKTEDIFLVGGPLNGKVLTFKIIEQVQTYLASSIWSADDRSVVKPYHVYGNRDGSNLYYLEDSYS